MSHDRPHRSNHATDQKDSDATTQLPAEPKTLSNTQLKKMRVKEWRRKQRENQNCGLQPDPPANPYDSYCPVFKSNATVSNEITKQVS